MILLLISLFLSQAHAAKEPLKPCLSDYDTQYINSVLKIRVGQDWDKCDPQNRYYQLVEALNLMQSLSWQGDAAPAPYNQEIIGYDWFTLFTSRVSYIAWGEAESPSTCSGSYAYAYPGTRNVYTCMHLYSTEENANYEGYSNVVNMVGTLIHEVRHLMGGSKGFPHTACNGVSQGCDKSAEYKGAMAAEMEAYAKLGLTASNLHPVQSAFARRMAYVTAVDRFVKRPVEQLAEGQRLPVFRTKDNRFVSAANSRVHTFFTGLKAGRLVAWMGGLFDTYLLLPEDGSAPEFVSSWNSMPRTFPEFNEEETPASGISGFLTSPVIQRLASDRHFSVGGGLVSLGNFAATQLAWLIGDKVVIEYGEPLRNDRPFQYQGQFEFSLPNGEHPISIRSGAVTNKIDSGYIYVASDQDRLYKFTPDYDLSARPTKLLGYKMTQEANPFPGYTHAYGLDDFIYLLDKEGRAFRLREGGKPHPVPGLESYRFSSIEFHYYHDVAVPPELMKRQ